MSDTPRTDAVAASIGADECWIEPVSADFARSLERELAAAKAEVEALRADAERYREWKRAFREGECGLWNALCDANSDSEHDAAIDAALAKEKA